LGVSWMRFAPPPDGRHLKCLTTFVR
jgi:hypothetical protein